MTQGEGTLQIQTETSRYNLLQHTEVSTHNGHHP